MNTIPRALRALLGAAALAALVATAAQAAQQATQSATEPVTIYAAGSLKAFVGLLAKEKGPLAGLDLKPTFSSAGLLRARIEAGEKPDLFLSADMASPRKLAADGRTVLPPTAFARNRMCLYAPRALGITANNLVPRLLAKEIRIRASAPVADPSGDYAIEIFDRIDKLHPGAGKILRDKAQALRDALKDEPQAAPADLFRTNKIDVMIAYCSASATLGRQVPGLAAIPLPPALDPAPVFGLAVLADRPAVLRFALFLLSERGQALLAAAGLIPLLDTTYDSLSSTR
ncbi:ABC-type molybdate transport system substrate-binding protein [Methylovirgula ligni]|uniref:ABC-type molybdate transport system substrate-binding protein n=1 Tax=Methylovirgula ligni TaxID=569860 RepID=A0A3D9YVJ0_9HYPH|nr:ABC-type molybdate transport system substrate-binding protein [Methylovirgula ligni]